MCSYTLSSTVFFSWLHLVLFSSHCCTVLCLPFFLLIVCPFLFCWFYFVFSSVLYIFFLFWLYFVLPFSNKCALHFLLSSDCTLSIFFLCFYFVFPLLIIGLYLSFPHLLVILIVCFVFPLSFLFPFLLWLYFVFPSLMTVLWISFSIMIVLCLPFSNDSNVHFLFSNDCALYS